MNRNTVEPEFYVKYDSAVRQLSEPPLPDVHSTTSVGTLHKHRYRTRASAVDPLCISVIIRSRVGSQKGDVH